MSIVLIGGMARLERHYEKEAEKAGLQLRIFNRPENDIENKLKYAEAIVLFTNKVSHQSRNDVLKAARTHGIPVYMHHSCGVCTLRECLKCMDLKPH
jgi:hypothetical protein